MKTVTDLLNEHDWKQIPNCQGRFTMAEQQPDLTITDLLGDDCEPVKVNSVMARDAILIVPLEDGGVISYQRADGGCVHTLNTPIGFRRKLQDLGIAHLDSKNAPEDTSPLKKEGGPDERDE